MALGIDNITGIHTHIDNIDVWQNQVKPEKDASRLILFNVGDMYQNTFSIIKYALTQATDKNVFIFKNINQDARTRHIWNKIKGHPQTRVTLDLLYTGIVFFSPKLSTQNFKIRF